MYSERVMRRQYGRSRRLQNKRSRRGQNRRSRRRQNEGVDRGRSITGESSIKGSC
jgi:hypothetical protein